MLKLFFHLDCRNLPFPPLWSDLLLFALFFCSAWLVVLVVSSLSHYFRTFTSMCFTCEWPPARGLSWGRGWGLGAKDAPVIANTQGSERTLCTGALETCSLSSEQSSWLWIAVNACCRAIGWPQVFDPLISERILMVMCLEYCKLFVCNN